MKHTRWFWPLLTLTLAVGLGYYTGTQMNRDEKFVPIVKTYTVAPGRALEAESALRSLFRDVDSASVGMVENGILVVRIPRSFEKGIDEMMAQFRNVDAEQKQTIKMDYWLVRGVRNSSQNQRPSELKNLADALDSIETNDGKMAFELVEHLTSQGRIGNSSKVRGMVSSVKNTSSRSGDNINIALKYRSDFGEIEANVEVNDGQFVVVGQNNARKKDLAHATGSPMDKVRTLEGTDHIYYIVKGRVVE